MTTIFIEFKLRDGRRYEFTVDPATRRTLGDFVRYPDSRRDGPPSTGELRRWIMEELEKQDEKLLEDFCFSEISIDKMDGTKVQASIFKPTDKKEFESYLKKVQDSDGWARFETRNPDLLAALSTWYGKPKMAVPRTRMLQRGPEPNYSKPVFEQEYGLPTATVTVRFQKPE